MPQFSCFFSFLAYLYEQLWKKHISTRVLCAQHPRADQNIQQLAYCSFCVLLPCQSEDIHHTEPTFSNKYFLEYWAACSRKVKHIFDKMYITFQLNYLWQCFYEYFLNLLIFQSMHSKIVLLIFTINIPLMYLVYFGIINYWNWNWKNWKHLLFLSYPHCCGGTYLLN